MSNNAPRHPVDRHFRRKRYRNASDIGMAGMIAALTARSQGLLAFVSEPAHEPEQELLLIEAT
jgi:hypothetical protein